MNNAAKFALAGVAIAAFALLDFVPTIGVKSMVIRVLPISRAHKAELVRGLCWRALPVGGSAMGRCFTSHAPPEWRKAHASQAAWQSNFGKICNTLANALAAEKIGKFGDAIVIEYEERNATVFVGPATYYVDPVGGSVSWNAKDGARQSTECPNFK